MASDLVQVGDATSGEVGELNTFATLLSLTSDAVLAFDDQGTIVLSNEVAQELFRASSGELVGSDVRMLFAPAGSTAEAAALVEGALPFAMDGSTCDVVCEGRQHARVHLHVRCERVVGSHTGWMLVAHTVAADGADGAQDDRQRLVDELSRANRRLSGTLDIVLGTLDSLDLGTLFSRILVDITKTMDAWASLVYMSEHDGYRLRGSTESLGDVAVPELLLPGNPLVERAARGGKTLRLRVQPHTRDELREGSVAERHVFDEATQSSIAVPADALAPFASFMVAPVIFGGHTISIIVVGWRHVRTLHKDDAHLLDAVTEYLSVQLAGAIAAYRSQRASELDSKGSLLRERLIASASVSAQVLADVFGTAAEALDAQCVLLEGNPHQRTTMALLPHVGQHYVPFDLCGAYRSGRGAVLQVAEVEGLAEWLRRQGEPSNGVIALPGIVDDKYLGFLLVRDDADEPLDETELAFVSQLCADAGEVEKGERLRNRDKRISQALQHGMRNELQRVDGLTAQSCYSSATEAAYVGGDFYDLIRLPDRRACVIMGDVSGKGVEAASVSSAVKTALGAYAWEGIAPSRMVALLNDFLLGFSQLETFATLFVGIVDLQARTLSYCSAGHPPALLVRQGGGGELVTLGVQSGVVGAFSTIRYRDGSVDLRDGDVLVLYTDGVTEARDRDGAFFGEDGLREVVSREAANGFEGLCERVRASVAAFAGGRLEDDVALVAVRVDGA